MEANQGQPLTPKVALIDADIVLHRVGFTTNNDDYWIAKARANEMLDNILIQTGVTEFELWLSDNAHNNFRYQVYPSYKANRVAPKPKWHEELKAYLITEWGARFSDGMEADDYLGILQDEENGETVICSIDKDLMQIPGLHYNFVKQEWAQIGWEEATKVFFKQMAMGDVSDNIPGARGVGPVAAGKAIDPIENWAGAEFVDAWEVPYYACMRAVRDLYYKSWLKEFPGQWTRERETALWGHMLMIGRLIKIKRSFKEPLWGSQVLPLMEEYCASFTLPREEALDLFMEPILPAKGSGCPLLGHARASEAIIPDSPVLLTSAEQS